jgi:hypothetical protein
VFFLYVDERILRVEGASDEGGGGDVAEAHIFTQLFILLEDIRVNVLHHLDILRGGSQVLANG